MAGGRQDRVLDDAEPRLERPDSIERVFDPEAVRQLKASGDHDITVGGPGLAAQAIKAGLVDEWQLFLAPVVVGGGTPWLPRDIRVQLELLNHRRFGSGFVFLQYRART